MIPALTYPRYIQLVTNSGLYMDLKGEQLPELRLALVILAFVIAVAIGLGFLLRHEVAENVRLHHVIDDLHGAESEKEADAGVVYEKHGGAE